MHVWLHDNGVSQPTRSSSILTCFHAIQVIAISTLTAKGFSRHGLLPSGWLEVHDEKLFQQMGEACKRLHDTALHDKMISSFDERPGACSIADGRCIPSTRPSTMLWRAEKSASLPPMSLPPIAVMFADGHSIAQSSCA